MNNLEQLITELEQKIQYIDSERESLFQKLITLKNQQHNQKESLNQLIVDATVKAFQVNRNPKRYAMRTLPGLQFTSLKG